MEQELKPTPIWDDLGCSGTHGEGVEEIARIGNPELKVKIATTDQHLIGNNRKGNLGDKTDKRGSREIAGIESPETDGRGRLCHARIDDPEYNFRYSDTAGGHMTKDEILKKHKQYLFPSISTYYSDPLVTDHASMQHLWDVEGNKYLDFFGGIVTISVGHANPRVTSKIKTQVDRLQHASTVFPNEAVVTLAEKIAQITPGEISQSFFSNSGTEANEYAVQLARMFTGRFEIVGLRHGYSGRSALAQSIAGQNTWRKSLPGT